MARQGSRKDSKVSRGSRPASAEMASARELNPSQGVSYHFRALLSRMSHPFVAASFALVSYLLLAGFKGDFAAVSRFNYYPYLSDAFLNGQLHLRVMPPSTLDLVLFDGKYYLYWPPMPSLLMLPFVAIWGVGVSDHMFNAVVAACNVGLVAAVLQAASRRGVVELSPDRIGLLTVVFAFGTAHFILALLGQVWHTGQLVGLFGGLLMYWGALRFEGGTAFLVAGIGVSVTMLSRSSMTLIAIWPAFELIRRTWPNGLRPLLTSCAIGAAPVMAAAAGFALYNHQRFGSFSDMGVAYHLMGPSFRPLYEQYGFFSVHYVPANLYYQWVSYPLPLRPDSLQGASLILMTPVFAAAGFALARRAGSAWTLFVTCLIAYLPIMFLMGTGYLQWGPRYLMDLFPPLLLLVGMGVRSWSDPWLWLASAVSVLHYAIGVIVRV
jgi:hypothetical protein